MWAFTAAKLLTPDSVIEHPVMLVDEGRIAEIAARADRQLAAGTVHTDLGDGLIVPGYFDLHIHGSAGYDVMDDRPEALPAIERMLVRHGVTSYFPTTVTAPLDSMLCALDRLANAIEGRGHKKMDHERCAVPLGIHLEGPFLSHARRGVHPPEHLLPPEVETFERLWQAARGHIRMMTIAPELEGATELIAAAAVRGVCVSLGHSDSDLAATERAIAAGASHATHTFNAMRPLDHREPGILGVMLTDSRVSADLIADGIHLDPSVVKLVAQSKGPELTVLITDATAAAGMPDGRYRLGRSKSMSGTGSAPPAVNSPAACSPWIRLCAIFRALPDGICRKRSPPPAAIQRAWRYLRTKVRIDLPIKAALSKASSALGPMPTSSCSTSAVTFCGPSLAAWNARPKRERELLNGIRSQSSAYVASPSTASGPEILFSPR